MVKSSSDATIALQMRLTWCGISRRLHLNSMNFYGEFGLIYLIMSQSIEGR
jgi:hypothetical protein